MRSTVPLIVLCAAVLALADSAQATFSAPASFLETHLLVTWYGNPRSTRMGILGELSAEQRAAGLRRQAAEYVSLTSKEVVPAYHLVAVVAQDAPGADRMCRRRETYDVMRSLLEEARSNGFKLVLDVQPGRSAIEDELVYLQPLLAEPDVYLALDPEFDMRAGEMPGGQIGSMPAADVNAALDLLQRLIDEGRLPPKVLIVHQFTLAMLPDKKNMQRRPNVDLVLNMDGFGSQALKLSTYRAIMRQQQLPFAGVKLFYRLDTSLYTPEQVMQLLPTPSVVIYQ